jgi:hypothetical protein
VDGWYPIAYLRLYFDLAAIFFDPLEVLVNFQMPIQMPIFEKYKKSTN